MTIFKIKVFLVMVIVCFPIISYTQQQNRCRNEPNGRMFPMPERTSYAECINQQETVRHCRPGMDFDPFVRECKAVIVPSGTRAITSSQRGPCNNQPNGTFIADSSNRNRFYECINGEARSNNCPNNENFNTENQTCESLRNNARPAPASPRAPPTRASPTAPRPTPPRPQPQNYQRPAFNRNAY